MNQPRLCSALLLFALCACSGRVEESAAEPEPESPYDEYGYRYVDAWEPCVAGEYIAWDPGWTTDGTGFQGACGRCEESWSEEPTYFECIPWTDCGDGEVLQHGTPTQDRICSP